MRTISTLSVSLVILLSGLSCERTGAIISDVFAPGPIFLQGDHGKVMYRNIILTPIEE